MSDEALTSYDLYKPLRNRLRQYPLLDSLYAVWAYLQFLQYDQPFPADVERMRIPLFGLRPNTSLHEWELSLLAKELLLNSPEKGVRTLRNYSDMAEALNAIKNLEGGIVQRYPLIGEDILLEIYRIAHREFPWQTPPNGQTLLRYFRIFSAEQLRATFEARLGMTPSQLYTLGLSIAGHFLGNFQLRLPVRTDPVGIPAELGVRFVDMYSSHLTAVRAAAAELQSHDHDYAYTLNPLQFRPLIRVGEAGQESAIAPVTPYLIRRFTDGVFYDLCSEAGFGEAFGAAYQDYVGDVIRVASEGRDISVLAEQQFRDGKNRKDTIDWIVSDRDGHLFVECKTKRLRAEAKTLIASTAALDAELAKIAAAVIQAYKTIFDAQAGLYPHWKPDTRPIYPLIVTLEDWYAWGERILGPITDRVKEGLTSSGLDPSVLDRHPYTICSVAEFETAIQVMARTGIDAFMSKKLNGEAREWAVHAHMANFFRAEAQGSKGVLFPEDWRKINPVLAARAAL